MQEELLKWSKEVGILFNANIISSHGIGLSTPRNIECSEPLIFVPESHVLSEQGILALAESEPELQAWINQETLSEYHLLHRGLLWLWLRRPNPWFQTLPSSKMLNLPFNRRPKDIELLFGTSIYDATLLKRVSLEKAHSRFIHATKLDLSLEDWLLPFQWISSRALSHPKTGKYCLVPFIDYCNHHPTKANVRYDVTSTGDFYVIASDTIGKGQELLLDYGYDRGDADFLFNYGFVPPSNYPNKELRHVFDPKDLRIRNLLENKQYDILTEFFEQERHVLILKHNGEWHCELLSLLACGDRIELRPDGSFHSLYIGTEELVPGLISNITDKMPEINASAAELVARLCRLFLHDLEQIDRPSGSDAACLAEKESSLLRQFIN